MAPCAYKTDWLIFDSERILATRVLFQEQRRILEKAIEDTKAALSIAEECLMQREKRIGIDEVKDAPEKCLSKVCYNHGRVRFVEQTKNIS